jgi:AraC family transcriptional regulator
MKEATLRDYTERILRVLLHIQRNLGEDLALDSLASIAAFSPYHFHRIFRGMVGESVRGHVRRLRLERAATQLKLSDLPVTRIALDAGYETHESFTRAFREMFGVSPTGFRAGSGALPGGEAPSGVHYRDDGNLEEFEPILTGGRNMEVKIVHQEPQRVAFVRHVGPYDQCGRAWEKLCEWAGPQGYLGAGTRFLGLCHDDPEITPPEKIRYDACITVDESFESEGEIGVQEVEGGDYAMTTHFGPYSGLGDTYALLLGQWVPRHGRQMRPAPSFEVYFNDPGETDPEDLITDVYVPLV